MKMANKYFINELGIEATYLELRIFSYLECEEKIKKITEILNFLNSHGFITNLTMLYHSMMRAENMIEHQGVPSLTIDLRDEKFRFKYSTSVWLLLALVVVLSIAGMVWNIFNINE